MAAIAIIPARGGSRRIPHKNRRMFFGKPIIAYSIEAAKECGLFDKIVVSTDDGEIAEIASQYGVSLHRRDEALARDEVGTQEVTRHVLTFFQGIEEFKRVGALGFEYACCLYPVSPLVKVIDLQFAHAKLAQHESATYAYAVGANPLRDAGAFYFGRTRALLNRHPLVSVVSITIVLPDERVCDVNTPEDFNRALDMYSRLHGIPVNPEERITQCRSPSGVCDQSTCVIEGRCAWQ